MERPPTAWELALVREIRAELAQIESVEDFLEALSFLPPPIHEEP